VARLASFAESLRFSRSISDFFQSIDFPFQFNRSLLLLISRLDSTTRGTAHFYAFYILDSFVAWMQIYIRRNQITNLPLLLKSLVVRRVLVNRPQVPRTEYNAFLDVYYVAIVRYVNFADIWRILNDQFHSGHISGRSAVTALLLIHYERTL
jgi:hypothetical protein